MARDRIGSGGPEIGYSWGRGVAGGRPYGLAFSGSERESAQVGLPHTRERVRIPTPHPYRTGSNVIRDFIAVFPNLPPGNYQVARKSSWRERSEKLTTVYSNYVAETKLPIDYS